MNGIIIIIGVLMLLMTIKLFIEHNWIGLILFFFVLYLIFGIGPRTK